MTQLNPLRPIPFYAMSASNADAAPRALFAILDFATATQWEGDLLSQLQQKRFQSLRTIYADAMDCANDVTILFPQTQQRIVITAGTWAYIPVIVSDQMQFQITGASPDVFRLHLLNVDMEPVVGGVVGSGPLPPFPVSDITVSASPRLIGRYTAGAGLAEEIPVVAPFAISAGAISVQAAAQYNVFGRRTAGAGAMQDSTRQQLNIAGTDLSNTFSLAQVINTASVLPLTIRSTGGAFTTELYRDTAGAAFSNIASLIAYFNNTTPAKTIGASIAFATGASVAPGVESGLFTFNTRVAGTLATRVIVAGGMYGSTLGADPGAGNLDFNAYLSNGAFVTDTNRILYRRPYTFGTLPAAAAVFDGFAVITDGPAAPVWMAAAAGGGAVRTPVWSNFANWLNG